jgi:uncharacterized membrane protein
MPRIIVFILGCLFILFGKWLYANPRILAPSWWAGANPGRMKDFSRFLGVAFVFAGAASATFSIAAVFLGGFVQFILALVCASTVTWVSFRAELHKGNHSGG